MSELSVSMGNKQQGKISGTVLKVKQAKANGKQKNGRTKDSQLYPYKMEDGVTLELSFEAREKLIMAQAELHNAGVAKQQGEAMKEAAEDIGKIMTIFRRIANGDIVPQQDEKKLMEYNLEMYQIAKAAAAAAKNDDPKEYDSVDEEEKKRGGMNASEGSGSISATVEIPIASAAATEMPEEADDSL